MALCGVLALLAVTSSHAAVWPGENKDTIKMVAKDKWRHPSKQLKGKDTAQGRFSQYKNGEFSFEPHFAWSMKVPPRSVASIEMNPPAWTAVRIRENKNEQRMLLRSFSTDKQGQQNFVFVKNGKEIKIPLKDVTALEIVVDFSLRFPDPLPTPTAAQVQAANSYTLTKGSIELSVKNSSRGSRCSHGLRHHAEMCPGQGSVLSTYLPRFPAYS